MKNCKISFGAAMIAIAFSATTLAESGGQVFYRYGLAFSKNSRGSQVFTDTNGANGVNDSKSGWALGAGLDLPLMTGVAGGDILGEVLVDYSHFSRKVVLQTTSALLSGTNTSNVTVAELAVVVAPKYRIGSFADGAIRPWIIPMGLAFLVNSPPSNDSTYLDVGYHVGLGVEYRVVSAISLGVDFRYTFAANEPNVNSTYGTSALYAGINF